MRTGRSDRAQRNATNQPDFTTKDTKITKVSDRLMIIRPRFDILYREPSALLERS